MQTNFFREINFLALAFFPRENLLIAKCQCHFPREKNQCHFQKFHQFDEIFRENNGFGIGFSPEGKKSMPDPLFSRKVRQIDEFLRERESLSKCTIFALLLHRLETVYLVNYVEILLHDHFS